MRFLIQRVNHASVKVNGTITGSIQKGFLVLIGVSEEDTKEIADKMTKKLLILLQRLQNEVKGYTMCHSLQMYLVNLFYQKESK